MVYERDGLWFMREMVYGLLCYKQDTTQINFNVSWTQREAIPSHHRHDISSASVLYCKVIFTVSSHMGLVHTNDDKPVDTRLQHDTDSSARLIN